ncbi:tRNA_anti-like [Filimonas lacunae]|uniref:tRNA_anti-like n=1 Tax=Filimonas lacunae TaxID=477680 RepID=A0A173MGY1_9BACT|nr:hypothetical protein [Filimonas lacunae]BAV06678.1 hypothetical protein FLA_2697 [Filimonas lacunae]SIT27878.1 tRNA_anti-like [Filimonas lacunae]
MKKKLLFVLFLIICCAAAWGWYWYKKPRTSVAAIASTVTIPSTTLYYQYQQNAAAADSLYAGKVLTVTGVVDDVQHSDSTVSIFLHGAGLNGVNCSMAVTHNKKPLPGKGVSITIKGRCTGYLMDINLVDCIIE